MLSAFVFPLPRYQPVDGPDRDGLQEGPRALSNHAGQHQDHPLYTCAWVNNYDNIIIIIVINAQTTQTTFFFLNG